MTPERTSMLFVREGVTPPSMDEALLGDRPLPAGAGEVLAEHEAGAVEDRVVDVAL